MLKKIIAAGAILGIFACTQVDDGFVYGSSASEQNGGSDDSSSSSAPKEDSSSSVESSSSSENSSSSESSSSVAAPPVLITSAKQSALFKTYYYGYALKDGSPEDLEQYWDVEDTEKCPTTKTDKKPSYDCQLDSTNTVLRNRLTTMDADLHYDFPFTRLTTTRGYVELKEYILKGDGDQAALGLNVYKDDDKPESIGDLSISDLNGTVAFIYRYSGGAHTFRIVSKDDSNFWYKNVPATPSVADTATVRIPTSELAGMGSFEDAEFDISEVAKFLWVVEYGETPAQNEGSLRVENLNAEVE